ncbi:TonB-dependent siderophore receptor [Prosthecobacter sp.]
MSFSSPFSRLACGLTSVLLPVLAGSALAQTPAPKPKPKPAPANLAAQQSKVLPEIIITAKPDAYTAPYANTTTRSEIPLRQLPQSAQVITRTLIDHQLSQDPGDVVKNFSGVVGTDTREMNNALYFIRGFSSAPYQDNFQLYYPGPASESLINTERVEVVKGPTGTMFGGAAGGPLGGLLNYVSKRPEKEAHYMMGMNAGSWGAYGNIWDVNQPLDRNGRVLFRLTGDVRETRDVNPFIKGHLTSFFPTLAISLSDDTTLTLRGRYSDRSQTDYSGLPGTGTVNPGGFTFDRYTIFRAEDQPAASSKTRSLNAELKHSFNSDWNFILEANYIDMNFDQYSVFPSFFGAPVGTFFPVDAGTLLQNMHSFAFNARVNGKFETGALKHSLTTGMDFDQTTDSGVLLVNPFIGIIDVSNPAYPAFAGGGISFADQHNDYQTIAYFLQDQITFAERFHLMGSLRYSQVKIHDVDITNFIDSQLTERRVTGRAGASVDITDWVTAFVGWGQGFQAPIGVPIAGAKKLIEAEQWEAGFKFEFSDTLQGSLAWFHNERTNVPVAVGLLNVQSGVQRAQGIEADLVWQATPEFTVLMNYAYQDAVVGSSTTVAAGSRLPRIPEHSGRVALRYDRKEGALKGFGMGLGVTMATSREGDAANTFSTPAYATVDAQLSYTRGPASVSVGIQNLFDVRYYQPQAFLGGAVAPNAPFNVFCQATVRF